MATYLLSLMITGVLLMPQCVLGQIPTVCADEDSLKNLRCCPTTTDGVCGENANRGECVELNIDGFRRDTTDVRSNWPHYFTQVSFDIIMWLWIKQLWLRVASYVYGLVVN